MFIISWMHLGTYFRNTVKRPCFFCGGWWLKWMLLTDGSWKAELFIHSRMLSVQLQFKIGQSIVFLQKLVPLFALWTENKYYKCLYNFRSSGLTFWWTYLKNKWLAFWVLIFNPNQCKPVCSVNTLNHIYNKDRFIKFNLLTKIVYLSNRENCTKVCLC